MVALPRLVVLTGWRGPRSVPAAAATVATAAGRTFRHPRLAARAGLPPRRAGGRADLGRPPGLRRAGERRGDGPPARGGAGGRRRRVRPGVELRRLRRARGRRRAAGRGGAAAPRLPLRAGEA